MSKLHLALASLTVLAAGCSSHHRDHYTYDPGYDSNPYVVQQPVIVREDAYYGPAYTPDRYYVYNDHYYYYHPEARRYIELRDRPRFDRNPPRIERVDRLPPHPDYRHDDHDYRDPRQAGYRDRPPERRPVPPPVRTGAPVPSGPYQPPLYPR